MKNFLKASKITSLKATIRASQLLLSQTPHMWYRREELLQTSSLRTEMWTKSMTPSWWRTGSNPWRCAWLSTTSTCQEFCRKESVSMKLPLIWSLRNPFPLKSESGLECPVCLGGPGHPRAKAYTYARKDTLQRHFATHKLRQNFPEGRKCDYPGCDMVLYSLPKYKLHQNKVHNITL